MKEQVSVDREYIYTNELTSEITLISKVELERLHLQDRNIKNKIELLKSTIEKTASNGLGEFYIDKVILKVLESLSK